MFYFNDRWYIKYLEYETKSRQKKNNINVSTIFESRQRCSIFLQGIVQTQSAEFNYESRTMQQQRNAKKPRNAKVEIHQSNVPHFRTKYSSPKE